MRVGDKVRFLDSRLGVITACSSGSYHTSVTIKFNDNERKFYKIPFGIKPFTIIKEITIDTVVKVIHYRNEVGKEYPIPEALQSERPYFYLSYKLLVKLKWKIFEKYVLIRAELSDQVRFGIVIPLAITESSSQDIKNYFLSLTGLTQFPEEIDLIRRLEVLACNLDENEDIIRNVLNTNIDEEIINRLIIS